MLMATPLTTCSPRWVMQAKPCSRASATETAMPAPSASQAEPVTAAVLAAAKAAASILPSRLISMTPERSENSPAMAQNTSGVATRSVASKENSRLSRKSATARLAFLRGRQLQAGGQPQVAALDRTLHQIGRANVG